MLVKLHKYTTLAMSYAFS